MGRSLNRYGWGRHVHEKARLQAVMLMTLRGTPFIYYGDEIGMTNAHIPRKQIRDRYGKTIWPFYKGRDQGRTPMQWSAEAGGGFTDGTPWLPLHKDYYKINVESEIADQNSVLNTYRKLIALRKSMPVLQQGDIQFTKTGRNGVLSYTRTLSSRQIHISLNFSTYKRNLCHSVPDGYRKIFSTHQGNIACDENEKLQPDGSGTADIKKGNIILQPFEGIVWVCTK
jgi:Glycosidases